MNLFDFRAPSVNSFNRKRRHIGIRIITRIIYYPINGYPDSKLSVLSIPIDYAITTHVLLLCCTVCEPRPGGLGPVRYMTISVHTTSVH